MMNSTVDPKLLKCQKSLPDKGEWEMSSATAFVYPEALPDEFDGAMGMGELFAAIVDPEWALPCRSAEADLWFAEKPTELERAKQLCVDCPVRAQCLAGAVDRGEPWGVWGGEIFEKGTIVAQKRSRGRPRKNAVAPVSSDSADKPLVVERRVTLAA